MRRFVALWFGQLVSLTGSELTSFALGVWLCQRTGSVTSFAMLVLIAALPSILLMPLLGMVADLWDRRWVMACADLTGAAVVGTLSLLVSSGRFQPWHLYVGVGISSVARGLHLPAYTAATTLLVPREQLARAAGMSQLLLAASQIGAPVMGAGLLSMVGVQGVMRIDMASFLVAVAIALSVRLPRPEGSSAEGARRGQLKEDLAFGLRYILERPGLRGLLALIALVELVMGLVMVLVPPFILRSASAAALGLILSLAAAGMLCGSVLASAWRGFARKVHGMLGALALLGVSFIAVGLRPSLRLVEIGGFALMFWVPMVHANNQAIWQAKVAPAIQGRVFTVRWMLGWSCATLAYVIAGPLADHVFEPLLAAGGPLSGSVGLLIGTGPGRGIALLVISQGMACLVAAGLGFSSPRVRRVELELPDPDSGPPV